MSLIKKEPKDFLKFSIISWFILMNLALSGNNEKLIKKIRLKNH